MFEHDFEYMLGKNEMTEIYQGWISDADKIQRLADSDGRSPMDVVKDPIVGMIGEWGAYHWISSKGYKCEVPDCGIVERDEAIWDKDLHVLEDIKIRTASGNIMAVERSISCKSQLVSSTCNIGDEEPSWTWQLKLTGTNFRFADPILSNPDYNKLVIASWVDDFWKEEVVSCRYPHKKCKEGFRWKPRMLCFWWPDVFEYLSDPRKKSLCGKKKVLYYADIQHLRAILLSSGESAAWQG